MILMMTTIMMRMMMMMMMMMIHSNDTAVAVLMKMKTMLIRSFLFTRKVDVMTKKKITI